MTWRQAGRAWGARAADWATRGFVRDEVVRVALKALFEDGYLLEHATAFELTELGDAHLYSKEN